MKKNSIIILLAVVILGGMVFAIANSIKNSNTKKQHAIEVQERTEKEAEVSGKLEGLDIVPVIQGLKESTGSTEKKTQSETMDTEEIQILSFTNARQCNKLTYLKDECKNKFVYNLAKKNNDITYCETLTKDTEKQDCRDEIHYNLLTCGDIKNMTLKQKCEYNLKQTQLVSQNQDTIKKAEASSDSKLCSVIANYRDKETCIKNVAIKTKDGTLCNKILTDKTEQDRCSKNVSYELNRAIINDVYTKKDLSLCDKITDETTKKQCKSMSF